MAPEVVVATLPLLCFSTFPHATPASDLPAFQNSVPFLSFGYRRLCPPSLVGSFSIITKTGGNERRLRRVRRRLFPRARALGSRVPRAALQRLQQGQVLRPRGMCEEGERAPDEMGRENAARKHPHARTGMHNTAHHKVKKNSLATRPYRHSATCLLPLFFFFLKVVFG